MPFKQKNSGQYGAGEHKINNMSKLDKKRKKLEDRIKELEAEMFQNLKQKTSNTAEISLSDYQNKITELRKMLIILK